MGLGGGHAPCRCETADRDLLELAPYCNQSLNPLKQLKAYSPGCFLCYCFPALTCYSITLAIGPIIPLKGGSRVASPLRESFDSRIVAASPLTGPLSKATP